MTSAPRSTSSVPALASLTRNFALMLCCHLLATAQAATYYVDAVRGTDDADGLSPASAWRSLAKANTATLIAGDSLALAAGGTFPGQLSFEGLAGTAKAPIVFTSYQPTGETTAVMAAIDGRGMMAAVYLKNCSYVAVTNLVISADGGGWAPTQKKTKKMRCGVLVEVDKDGIFTGIDLHSLQVRNVSYQEPGFVRPAADVKSPNGNIPYGWGVRFMVSSPKGQLRDMRVKNCLIERVDHTGLKFTGPTASLVGVRVEGVRVLDVGGPGMQMSGVVGGHFTNMEVDHSGSTRDSRYWGRGSGLWTWGSSDVIIERSRFTNANGPGDSAGVHIDYNCRDVIVQYNLSANNAGGFCEILGNNYNCAYRYNVSVNDGRRIKGKNAAFQDGKIFWLSGYVGAGKRVGPFNSYFYNNTVYVDDTIEPRLAVGSTADGVLIANNIFYFKRAGRTVPGDQLSADQQSSDERSRVFFKNNLFLRADNWPADLGVTDRSPIFGDPQFANPGGLKLEDYIPGNRDLVKGRGVSIPALPGDKVGLKAGLAVSTDVLGRRVAETPDLGAIALP